MKIKRTANAGVLLSIDNQTMLLDGVCSQLSPYLGTPRDIYDELTKNYPDAVCFTHSHIDHYDEDFARRYESDTKRHIITPKSPDVVQTGDVSIYTVATRHIGKTDVEHASFIIKASRCVYFAGDATPLWLKNVSDLPSPDVLILPYAYATTRSSWQMTKQLKAKLIVLVHMPRQDEDAHGIWNMVRATIGNDVSVVIPDMAQTIEY